MIKTQPTDELVCQTTLQFSIWDRIKNLFTSEIIVTTRITLPDDPMPKYTTKVAICEVTLWSNLRYKFSKGQSEIIQDDK